MHGFLPLSALSSCRSRPRRHARISVVGEPIPASFTSMRRPPRFLATPSLVKFLSRSAFLLLRSSSTSPVVASTRFQKAGAFSRSSPTTTLRINSPIDSRKCTLPLSHDDTSHQDRFLFPAFGSFLLRYSPTNILSDVHLQHQELWLIRRRARLVVRSVANAVKPRSFKFGRPCFFAARSLRSARDRHSTCRSWSACVGENPSRSGASD